MVLAGRSLQLFLITKPAATKVKLVVLFIG